MIDWGSILLATFVLGVGLRLSAFFSGSETGFYRVSFLRLRLDAQAGDGIARRLIWFARNPSYFVATTLIGNNVSNYLITLAVSWLTFALFHRETMWLEIAATLASAPVVFIFGELVPKSVYYRIPMQRLRNDIAKFNFFFRLFFPLVLPLIALTRLLKFLTGGGERTAEMVLGRAQLVQLLSQGHQIGLLTDVQSRLIHGLLHTAAESVADSITPVNRILGVSETASVADVLDFARKYGLTSVPIRRSTSEQDWFGYVRVTDAAINGAELAALVRTMLVLDASKTKLEAILQMQEARALFAAVYSGDRLLGIAHAHGLTEQLFRPRQNLGVVAVPEPR